MFHSRQLLFDVLHELGRWLVLQIVKQILEWYTQAIAVLGLGGAGLRCGGSWSHHMHVRLAGMRNEAVEDSLLLRLAAPFVAML